MHTVDDRFPNPAPRPLLIADALQAVHGRRQDLLERVHEGAAEAEEVPRARTRTRAHASEGDRRRHHRRRLALQVARVPPPRRGRGARRRVVPLQIPARCACVEGYFFCTIIIL